MKMENLSFILVCAGVFAGLVIIAALFEKYLCKDRKAFSNTHYISYTAIFAAMSGVLMIIELPVIFAPFFYKLDFSEVPVMICTFYLGPVAGVVCEFLKVLIKLLLKGTSTAFVGDFANFAVGCAFVLPASIIYHAKPGKKTAVTGMAVGTIIMTIFGTAFNAFYLIPKFVELFHMPLEDIINIGHEVNGAIHSLNTLVFYAVAPLNLLKGALITLITFLLYKRISPLLHKGDAKRVKKAAKNA